MRRLVPSLALLLPVGALAALESPFVGPRATGMGGANVASVDNATAQYFNPAAFGFMNVAEDAEGNDNAGHGERFLGINLIDLQAGYRVTGDLPDRLEFFADFNETDLSSETTFTEAQANELIRLADNLAGLDDPGNTIAIDLNAGSHVRIGKLAVGARAFGTFGGLVSNIDLTNLGLNAPDLNDQLDEARGASTPTGSTFTADQRTELSNAGVSSTNIDYLDHLVSEQIAAGTTSESEVDGAVDLLVQVANATSGSSGDLADNTTAVVARGIGIFEVPVSYGYAVTPDLAVGATAKLMFGRVYGTTVLIFDEDNDDVIDQATEEYEETLTVGLDVAVMYRLPTLTLGAVGRNLNAPEFDGFTTSSGIVIEDVELDPQVTIGAAWYPLPGLVVEGNLDLLEEEALVGDYDRQYFAAGVEWDVLDVLAIRGGGYTNLADSDIGPVLTAGLGVDLYLVRLDFALASSLDTAEFEGEDVPEEARFSFGLAAEF